MLIRVRGGDSGIREYLEKGQKQDRDFDRDHLDERVILSGDLKLTGSIIDNMTKQGEKYLHITLAFREDEISRETLQNITDEFQEFAFSAYENDEYNFYAEAHLPRIKSYHHQRTGEFVERKPHIHIVLPEYSLLSGHNLNPLGKVDQQTKFLEAFQEHINAKYGLASPKDHQRLEITGESEMISRYKGDIFHGVGREIKTELLDSVIKNKVTDWQQFQALVSQFGAIKTRHGRDGDYLNMKLEGAAKGINLKEPQFSQRFIELPTVQKLHELATQDEGYSIPSRPKPMPEEIKSRLAEWHNIRAREIRYINSGNRKLYTEYKAADQDRRYEILIEREQKFSAKWRENERSDSDQGTIAHLEDDLRTAGRHIESISRTNGSVTKAARGVVNRRTCRAVSTAVRRLVRDQATPSQEQCQTESVVHRRSDSVVGQHHRDLIEQRQEARAEADADMAQIKRELDATRLLAAVSHSHGVQPERYDITKGRDGSDRIRCGSRNLNVSDFLTKELNLPWPQAAQVLRDTYAGQQGHEPEPHQQARVPRRELWEGYRRDWQPQQRKQREREWKEQQASERDRWAELRREYQAQRSAIQNDRGLRPVERKATLSLARMEKVQRDLALREQIQAEREDLKACYQLRPAEQYRAYLSEQVEHGNTDALTELRRQRVRQPLPAGERIEHREPGREGRPHLMWLAHTVDQAGNVTYYNDQRALFTDTGRTVEFAQTNSERETLEQGLRLALAKFGSSLRLNGTKGYKQQIADLAADVGLHHIDFNDEVLNGRHQQRIAAIRAERKDDRQQPTKKTPDRGGQDDLSR